MRGVFYSKVNDNGTYGEPIKLENMTDFTLTSSPVSERNEVKNILADGFEGTLSLDFKNYTEWKEFIWKILLNLKRSEKRLISKNIWKEANK